VKGKPKTSRVWPPVFFGLVVLSGCQLVAGITNRSGGSLSCPSSTDCAGTAGASGSGGVAAQGGLNTAGQPGADAGGPTSDGSAGRAAGGATGGSVGTGGSAGSSGASATAGSAGTAGAGPRTGCTVKATFTTPQIATFEDYDGTPLSQWLFSIGPIRGLAYAFDDMTGSPTFGLVPGANSQYALAIYNELASVSGGGLGIWTTCADAHALSGLSFRVKGFTPTSQLTVQLLIENTTAPPDGTCTDAEAGPGQGCTSPSASIPITQTWTLLQLPWASFTGGSSGTGAAIVPNGDNVIGALFIASLVYAPDGSGNYVAQPGTYDVALDDIGFY
jgi:hypothetical protein